jgi:hypothetical protein
MRLRPITVERNGHRSRRTAQAPIRSPLPDLRPDQTHADQQAASRGVSSICQLQTAAGFEMRAACVGDG